MRDVFAFKVVIGLVVIVVIGLSVGLPSMAMGPDEDFKQGTELLKKGQLEPAIAAFTRAINADPSYVEAYNNRGLAYYEQGKFDRAETDFLMALDLDPDNEIANSNLGILYFEKGSYEKAIEHLEEAVGAKRKTKPHDAVILRNLAFIYKKMGYEEKAESLTQAATSIERNSSTSSYFSDQYLQRTVGTRGADHVLVIKIWQRR